VRAALRADARRCAALRLRVAAAFFAALERSALVCVAIVIVSSFENVLF
jgi:hypothetical protein